MENKVAIIGIGNIGRRHLQAVCNDSVCKEVFGYDIRPQAIEDTKKFIEDHGINHTPIRLISSGEEFFGNIDHHTIVIIASTANGRVAHFEGVLSFKPKAVIVEKPLCQAEMEYKKILALSKKYKVPVYVDFHRHMYDEYQQIAAYLKKSRLRFIHTTTWGGMACNGIHVLELITWLAGAREYKILDYTKPRIYNTKRKGFKDFEGSVVFSINKNIICSVSATDKESLETYDIAASDRQYFINESVSRINIVDKKGKQEEEAMNVLFLSQITGKVVKDIIKGAQHVKLPRIEETFLAHKILFDYMKRAKISTLNFT